jgi:hypothetical protein
MIMKHADTSVFLNHYLSRRITTDTQAIVRGTAPQEDIMKAACRMSRSIDPNRPWRLTPEQSQSIDSNPQIQKLLRKREVLEGRNSEREQCIEITKQIRNKKQRLRNALLKHSRSKYDKEQAAKDIQFQLSGSTFSETIKADLERTPDRTPEHIRLIESIMSLPGSNLNAETKRRIAAINAVATYCRVEEGKTPKSRRTSNSDVFEAAKVRHDIDPQEELEAAKVAVCKEKRPRKCFMCIGNTRSPIQARIHTFSTPGDLSKHFRRKHLSKVGMNQKVKCMLCEFTLDGMEHLQQHAFVKHGTVS